MQAGGQERRETARGIPSFTGEKGLSLKTGCLGQGKDKTVLRDEKIAQTLRGWAEMRSLKRENRSSHRHPACYTWEEWADVAVLVCTLLTGLAWSKWDFHKAGRVAKAEWKAQQKHRWQEQNLGLSRPPLITEIFYSRNELKKRQAWFKNLQVKGLANKLINQDSCQPS